ncbi:hypothetical protein MLD38_020897 [Melastoma candidum]|uniref:Uncharacterized protein n=1 Tax=Melastoma candidum TaxID=119954 RepID=A0ACB9QEL5_9MYRT|nr:hypothetical protein MLD38_020897 [Melastoma candidum]
MCLNVSWFGINVAGYDCLTRYTCVGDRADAVPKGHLAIHVGQPGHEMCRVIVPVSCINHSLFQELLDRVEPIYSYYHPGAINLPCSISEYEAVRRSIAASENPDRAVLEQKKKKLALSYLRNSFSKILVLSTSEY